MPRVGYAQMVEAIETLVIRPLPDVLDGEYVLAAARHGDVGAVTVAWVEGEAFHLEVEVLFRRSSRWESIGGSGTSGEDWSELASRRSFGYACSGFGYEHGWLWVPYGTAPPGAVAVELTDEVGNVWRSDVYEPFGQFLVVIPSVDGDIRPTMRFLDADGNVVLETNFGPPSLD